MSESKEPLSQKIDTSRDLPNHIQSNPLKWFYGPIWGKPHNLNSNFSIVICGKPGSGKTWLATKIAETLDCSRTGEAPRFSVVRVAFTAKEFLEIVSKDWPIGSVIIFDDAGLGAFSREAMQQEVRDIAKIFQSIRYKRWIIILTLPAFGMLDKVVRQLLNCYLKPGNIDRHKKLAQVKVRWIDTNEYTGDVYFKRPVFEKVVMHPYGMHMSEFTYIDTVWFPAPTCSLAKEIDYKKDVSLSAWRNMISQRIISKESSSDKKVTTKKILDEVVSHPDKFYGVIKGGTRAIVPENILDAFDECSDQMAVKVAGMANRRLGVYKVAGGISESILAKKPKS